MSLLPVQGRGFFHGSPNGHHIDTLGVARSSRAAPNRNGKSSGRSRRGESSPVPAASIRPELLAGGCRPVLADRVAWEEEITALAEMLSTIFLHNFRSFLLRSSV